MIPNEYYFRIHHVRPRFKGDIENVLIYFAEELSRVGEKSSREFAEAVNAALWRYPGNAHKTKKTIDNWRTEISALFGFIEHMDTTDRPGLRALELAQNQDLVEAFKIFLYNFQYPGAYLTPNRLQEQINAGIHFKPAQYILRLLRYANASGGNSVGITKEEATHCIFNDLRVTRDNEGVEATWERITQNRNQHIRYDTTGDVVRYAGDIIDYMEIANLLRTYDGKLYYLNTLEEETIIKFCESTEWFTEYDTMIRDRSGDIQAIKNCAKDWFSYVNRDMSDTDFSTDVLAYIADNQDELRELRENALPDVSPNIEEILGREIALEERINSEMEDFTTKDIGDIGEGLVHGHECMRVKLGGREDLIHLIMKIPTQFAVGYDIASVELDERRRFIEVKTTISSKPLRFREVHLTKNEWNTAESVRDRYYVYRLMISKNEKKLFLLQDPVGLYKNDRISMVPADDGADITFNPSDVGEFEELLTWRS